jgi:hypothetical protein
MMSLISTLYCLIEQSIIGSVDAGLFENHSTLTPHKSGVAMTVGV